MRGAVGVRAALALVAAVVLLPGSVGAAGPAPIIDAHSHYSAEDAAVFAPAGIVATLDAAGVQRIAVASVPPMLALTLHEYAPDRVLPLLGVYATPLAKLTWMHDERLPEQVTQWLQAGPWVGLGELHLFARDAGSPVFARLVRLAAERGLVLLIHGDAEVIDQAFALAPEVRVLWAHLGTFPVPDLLDAMLEKHGERLWIDTSVRDERIAPDGVLLPQWRALFERHAERFVVGVDAFSVNRWRHYGEVVARIRTWTDDLPEPLRTNLLHDNAARLFAGLAAGER